MAYRKTLDINYFSKKSIDDAIKILEEELESIEFKWNYFLTLVAEGVEKELAKYYPASITLSHRFTDDGIVVSANGNGLLFIEFGTGNPADESQGLRFGFGAGSWSEWHAQTYQEWLRSGGTAYSVDGHYMFDGQGKDAFMQVENMLHSIVKQSADEVFKK